MNMCTCTHAHSQGCTSMMHVQCTCAYRYVYAHVQLCPHIYTSAHMCAHERVDCSSECCPIGPSTSFQSCPLTPGLRHGWGGVMGRPAPLCGRGPGGSRPSWRSGPPDCWSRGSGDLNPQGVALEGLAGDPGCQEAPRRGGSRAQVLPQPGRPEAELGRPWSCRTAGSVFFLVG